MNNAEFNEFADSIPPSWDSSQRVFIYGLIDPETGLIRYIGKSIRPPERLTNHMNERSNCHRSHWLQSLRSRGLRPEMVILECISGEWPWQESERYWIKYGRHHGWPLTNNTNGGDGVSGLPAETRALMAKTWAGRKHRPESLKKIAAASSSRRHSAATKAKMSKTRKGRVITWGAKLSSALYQLTVEQADAIHSRLSAGERVCTIATELGMHRTTISKIKKGTYRGK